MISQYLTAMRNFSRDAWLFLLTSALFGFAIFGGIYQTLLNLFLLRLGYEADFAGTVNGSGQLAFGLMAVPFGVLGRYLGLKRLLIAGMAMMVSGFGLLPVLELSPVSQEWWIIGTHIVGQLGIALYFVTSGPFLMMVTSPTERNHVYALNIALWPLAGFAGSLIAGFMPGFFGMLLDEPLSAPLPYRYPLIIAAGLMVFAIWAFLNINTGGQVATEIKQSGREIDAAPWLIVTVLCCSVLLRVAGEGVVRTFINIYLDSGLNMLPWQTGALIAFGQLLAVPAALTMPLIAARWGDGGTYLLSVWGMAPSLLLMAFIPHWTAAGLGFMGMMALISIARPAITVFQMEAIQPKWRTLMAGSTTTAVGLGWSLGSFGGGVLVTRYGFGSLFLFGAILAVGGALIFWGYFRPQRPVTAQQVQP